MVWGNRVAERVFIREGGDFENFEGDLRRYGENFERNLSF